MPTLAEKIKEAHKRQKQQEGQVLPEMGLKEAIVTLEKLLGTPPLVFQVYNGGLDEMQQLGIPQVKIIPTTQIKQLFDLLRRLEMGSVRGGAETEAPTG